MPRIFKDPCGSCPSLVGDGCSVFSSQLQMGNCPPIGVKLQGRAKSLKVVICSPSCSAAMHMEDFITSKKVISNIAITVYCFCLRAVPVSTCFTKSRQNFSDPSTLLQSKSSLSFAAFLFPSGAKWHSKKWIVNSVQIVVSLSSSLIFLFLF